MNILLLPETKMLATAEGTGGLFDFNATLPLMAIQFVLLTIALTFLFYKPVSKVIDEREAYISGNLTTASEKLIKADELYQEYDKQLEKARATAKATIATSEKQIRDQIAEELGVARGDAPVQLEEALTLLNIRKAQALQRVDSDVDDMCVFIQAKFFGDYRSIPRSIPNR
jgi:F-type H+-transporting ATPase subunit b